MFILNLQIVSQNDSQVVYSFPTKKWGKTHFSVDNNITKLHHIFWLRWIFFSKWIRQETSIFRCEIVLSYTDFRYFRGNYEKKRIYWWRITQLETYSLNSDFFFLNEINKVTNVLDFTLCCHWLNRMSFIALFKVVLFL